LTLDNLEGQYCNRNCIGCTSAFFLATAGLSCLHVGERPYRCPQPGCDRAFADKSNLRSHLLIHNADGKHYICTRCNRAFAQKRYLHKHRLEVCKI